MEKNIKTLQKIFSKQSLLWFLTAYVIVALPPSFDYLFQKIKDLHESKIQEGSFVNIADEPYNYSYIAPDILPWWLLGYVLIVFPSIFVSLRLGKPKFLFFYFLCFLLYLALVSVVEVATWRGMWDAGDIALSTLMMAVLGFLPFTLCASIYWMGFMRKERSSYTMVLVFSVFIFWCFEWFFMIWLLS